MTFKDTSNWGKTYVVVCGNDDCCKEWSVRNRQWNQCKHKLFACSKSCRHSKSYNAKLFTFTKKTNLERFGSENPFGNSLIKASIKETLIEKYGVDNIFKDVKYIQGKFNEKYGVINPQQVPEFNKTAYATRVSKYAGDLMGCVVKSKSEATCMGKYGSKYFFSTVDFSIDGLRLMGWSEDQISELSAKKAITLDNLVKLYGDEGESRYNAWKAKVRQARSDFVRRHGDIIGNEKFNSTLAKRRLQYNRTSQEALVVINEILNLTYDSNTVYYGANDKNEWFLSESGAFYLYDLTFLEEKVIIEFNGRHVHPDKASLTAEQWEKWRCVWPKKTADEVHNRDTEKIALAERKGFTVFVLWLPLKGKLLQENIKDIVNYINNKGQQ